MITIYTDGKAYGITTTEGLIEISHEMYECFLRQYRLMGWKEETCGGITHFFPKTF